ncbi:MAG: nucleotidyltransferase domain-containing protein [Spirochaetia bacterium]|nr:nucleotidyltransferase domain-containing protein [Spirochaetia bacterium]
MPDFGLSDQTIGALRRIFSEFPEIKKAVIYGSRAKGNYKTGSDIDLVLDGEFKDSSAMRRIEEKIDDLYLPYKIDLTLYSQISNQDLLDHIKRAGRLFYEN